MSIFEFLEGLSIFRELYVGKSSYYIWFPYSTSDHDPNSLGLYTYDGHIKLKLLHLSLFGVVRGFGDPFIKVEGYVKTKCLNIAC